MSELSLEGVWTSLLRGVSLRLEAGCHALLGDEADGAGELVDLCAGVLAPRRGRVRLGGESPSASRRCRREIASLLAREDGVASGDVLGWVSALEARGVTSAREALDASGLEPRRSLRGLSGAERRELACWVALSHPAPRLVVLHEPLAAAGARGRQRLLQRLAERARQVPVLVATASLADARRLGGEAWRLDRGLLSGPLGSPWPRGGAGAEVRLDVDSDAPRALLAALAAEPLVRGILYAEETGRLTVRGADHEQLSAAVARAAVAASVNVGLLRARPDSLDSGRSLESGRARPPGAHPRSGLITAGAARPGISHPGAPAGSAEPGAETRS